MLDQVFRFLLLKVLVASAISQSQIRDFRKFTHQGEDSTSETMLRDTDLSSFYTTEIAVYSTSLDSIQDQE